MPDSALSTPSSTPPALAAGAAVVDKAEESQGRVVDKAVNLQGPAPAAGEPEVPEPVAYCEPHNPDNAAAFAWPGSERMDRHKADLYGVGQIKSYGDARAEHARRVALTDFECDSLIAALCPDFSDERFPDDRPIMRELARDALIRAAAPQQGETR